MKKTYTIEYGKFGAYFMETDEETSEFKEMPLKDVLDVLNGDDRDDTDFLVEWNKTAGEVHDTAVEKGWWDKSPTDEEIRVAWRDLYGTEIDNNMSTMDMKRTFIEGYTAMYKKRNTGEAIALMHSELSEALEGDRAGDPPDDKIPSYSSMEAELADVVIRIMDWSKGAGLEVGEAIMAKIAMNKGREKMHGGKKY